jgi:hypothetical protein
MRSSSEFVLAYYRFFTTLHFSRKGTVHICNERDTGLGARVGTGADVKRSAGPSERAREATSKRGPALFVGQARRNAQPFPRREATRMDRATNRRSNQAEPIMGERVAYRLLALLQASAAHPF